MVPKIEPWIMGYRRGNTMDKNDRITKRTASDKLDRYCDIIARTQNEMVMK